MIELKNIHKKFGEKVAIVDASCKFSKGETTVILGHSGSGKTTLIRCVNMLEKADKGQIYYDGTKVTEKNIHTIRLKMAMVFQSFNLFVNMNVLENLTYAPLQMKIMNKDDAEKKAREILASLNIRELESLPSKLSGGQKQRVAIARALMMDPEVILFDEPTSALDPEAVKDIVSIIDDLKKKLTIIVVSHHVTFAKKIADNVIFMDQGHILADQKSEDFFQKPNSVRAKLYLDTVAEFG